MEEKQMTAPEIIEETIKIITNVCVPVAFSQTIGMPLYHANNNLRIALEMMKKQPEEQPEEGVDDGVERVD